MGTSTPTWQLILACADELTALGEAPFTRKQLIQCIQLRDPSRKPGTINPIIQGMTVNLSGGPFGRGAGSLRSVGHGQFVLEARGMELPDSAVKAAGSDSTVRSRGASLDEYPISKLWDLGFYRICELEPERERDGSIRILQPQSQYANREGLSLNRYGAGPFCRFRIPSDILVAGVYAITKGEEILYVGECQNLSGRFNTGYGLISPRNCFQGGQETNCRLNALILREVQDGDSLSLYFHPCDDYKELEARLRREFRPPWNRI